MSESSADSSRVTLARIAEVAGVSIPTVSKVVNRRPDVAQRTRQRVERVMTELGYVGNVAARSLRSGRTGFVDLVVEDLESAYQFEVIRGVEAGLAAAGLGTVLSVLDPAGESNWDWFAAVRSRRADGVILVTHSGKAVQVEELRRRGAPLVLIDHWREPGPDVPSVGATNWSGGFAATDHLITLGHRRIAMIGGPGDLASSRARTAGYRAALDRAGIPWDPDLYRVGDFLSSGGSKHTSELLALDRPPSAIFAGSDLAAFGVLHELRRMGRAVPDDVSVVGFDDIPMARFVTPELTTVHQPLVQMGRTAATMIMRLIEGQPLDATRVELATSLVIRSSTRSPTPGD